jgi:hypothetical protein
MILFLFGFAVGIAFAAAWLLLYAADTQAKRLGPSERPPLSVSEAQEARRRGEHVYSQWDPEAVAEETSRAVSRLRDRGG